MTVNLHAMIRVLALLLLCCNVTPVDADLILATSETANPPKDLQFTFGDSEGYIWYATQRGIYRDDKFSLKFFPIAGEEIPVNMISEDSKGNLFLATNKGAWIFSKRTYTFEPLDSARFGGKNVSFIKVTTNDNLWVGTKGKLSRYNSNGEWKKDYVLTDRRGNATTVSGFCESGEGNIYMTSYSAGILKYDKQKDRFVLYRKIPNGESLGAILQDKDYDYFWVHDFQGKVYRFDPEAASQEKIFVGSQVTKYGDYEAKRQWVRDMIQDPVYGYIWCSSRHGLHVLRPDKDGHLTTENVPSLNELDGSFINGLLQQGGAIRVTCYNNPSLVIHLNDSCKNTYRLPAIRNRFRNMAAINDVVADDDKNLLWLLQMRTGLLAYDLTTDKVSDSEQYHAQRLYKGSLIAKSLIFGGVWISGPDFNSVFCVDHDHDMNMVVKDSVSVAKYLKEGETISQLLEDDAARLWVGTNDALLMFDLRKLNKGAKRFQTGEVLNMITTPGGILWTAGKSGLTNINPKDGRVKTFPHSEAITAIAHSTDGNIWAGSKTGKIFSFNPVSGEWLERGDWLGRDGERIDEIFSDKYGHIWILSESTLTQFNPRNNAHRRYRAGKRGNLDLYLGATLEESPKEVLIVSGIGGIATFTPSSTLDGQPVKIRVNVSDVKVNGESVYYIGGEYGFNENGLHVPSDAANIEFHFTAPGNINSSEIRFAYKMEGVDENWNYTEPGSNRAFYNSLPKGNHRLLVKACDENSCWTDTVTTIKVNRDPALYATWWAIIIYVLAGIALIAYFLYRYSQHVKDKNETMWADSIEMINMRTYLESPVNLPNEEFHELDKILLKKATEVVENNISVSEFSVADLASGVNMSKSTLARKLKAISGKTPSDFIKDIRIKYACHLLESQNHSVGEVADMVGFDERRYFTSIFKKEVGVTPSAYQKGERRVMQNPEASAREADFSEIAKLPDSDA